MGVYGALICHVWVSTSFSETTESRGVKIGRKSPQRGNGYWAHKIFTTLRTGDKQVKEKQRHKQALIKAVAMSYE